MDNRDMVALYEEMKRLKAAIDKDRFKNQNDRNSILNIYSQAVNETFERLSKIKDCIDEYEAR